ncbi:UNVERIFIED_CONTAM: hypothetical protein GTU68_049228, partial [Idotea baltica]|nr:hypothetical protein [Idotea baltica]
GTRVIAIFDENDSQSLYVGIIAENPTGVNKFRYLIFFDDGYAQYINHQNVRVVIQSSTHVWEDVAVKSRDFIKDYLQTYPERPMVRLLKYKYIKTELDGKWWRAQVLEIDGSLVKMFFPALDRNEWIYRGSTRLSPLFEKKISMKVKSEFPNKIIRRRTMPVNKSGTFVEYVNFDNVEKESQELALVKPQVEKRSVARKSSAAKASNLNTIPIKDQLVLESEGFYTSHKQSVNIPKFYRHQCSPKCIKESNEIIYSKVKSPLVKPLLLGWNREVSTVKKRTIERMVCNYVAPCGRRLRSLEEILMYLRLTKSSLEVDFFTVDKDISLRRLWIPSKSVYYDKDITDGKEDIHISCVNSIENESPNKLIYSSVRIPSVNVDLNLNPEYLVCCSCEDDCKDKSQCECWQLTLDSASPFTKDNKFDIGYKYRRLSHQVSTGIFECNSQCSCKKSCLNRVVQFPIRQQLQLFKTAKRGWGVRTLNDIPKGSFICVYVGKVLTETEANEDGMIDGADDYYANLDFIEVVTSMKEGYESEAENIEGDELPDSGWSDLDEGGKDSNGRESHPRKRSRGKKDAASNGTSESRFLKQTTQNGNDSEESNDSTIPCPQTFEPSKNAGDLMWTKQSFNREEDMTMYVMDAKTTGNVGRYLNHSCEPNVFVQNVFVDTHDLKFPWISFFAGNNIKAGMELTWDYNYDVGSVPGRVKYCYCRSNNCRGRLL